MRRSEQNVVYEICQKFLQEHIPEYVRDIAQELITENGIQKIDIQEGDTWTVRALIQGEDFQVYTPTLVFSLNDLQMHQQCTCQAAFSGSCTHVAALLLRLIEDLRAEDNNSEEESLQPQKDWKNTFHSFFSSEVDPEPGRHYLIFRFTPEEERL
ncbi:MAG: ATP-dependent helicase, partial [Desulfovibrio sp.]|nr:ATP-dependent helicase [Desulfovibrio sp.]